MKTKLFSKVKTYNRFNRMNDREYNNAMCHIRIIQDLMYHEEFNVERLVNESVKLYVAQLN